ncbi:restriction endonuclease subunit S [Streptomyces sp. NBC_00320]|uniref:restriction endonuclease subunit S n=1 Tax=Streptomyces sp. NBC_00320 TaxID=2975711 RepID=UPI0022517B0D|nr:restriction endonuclease subunit S [Streptomyces sp. NBC_00320]MCX5145675.1 restriction endonuclease subunit S [Streptomyces sp. NBC_00320]
MSLNLDKTTWKRVRLGDVIRRSRTQANPANGDVERYVGGGHIDSDSLTIERFGDVSDGQMGSTFTYVFQPGQILFVSARPYLRKSGVVNFSGVVADKTYVLDAAPENGLLQEFLPFVLASDHFIAYATAEASGSMNPRLLWGRMQCYEFDLPPLDEQQRLANLLWAVERHSLAVAESQVNAAATADTYFSEMLSRHAAESVPAPELIDEMTVGVVVRPTQYYTDDRLTGVPALRGLNVRPGGFDLTDLVYFSPESAAGLQKSTLREGDVVVIRTGRPGDAAVVPAEVAGYNCIDLIIVRPGQHIDSKFVELFLNSGYGRAQILRRSAGTAQQHFNVGALKKVQIPVLPLDEQRVLVSATTEIQSVSDRFADELDNLRAMRGAMLNNVFGGAE